MVRKKGSPPGLLCLTIALCARRRINITNNFTQPYKDLKPTIDAHYILKIFWQALECQKGSEVANEAGTGTEDVVDVGEVKVEVGPNVDVETTITTTADVNDEVGAKEEIVSKDTIMGVPQESIIEKKCATTK
ncbi:hypothetical protein GYH30_000882 [Glycine max]|nr:hypothetical protein GYH30_000882 [Glycine max]